MSEVRQAQHTPAPWYWQEFGTCGSDGPSAFRIEAGTGTIADTYAYSALDEANARLIAAAPELLRAAQRAWEQHPTCLRDEVGASYDAECHCIACSLKSAIAKATGGAL